MLSVNELFKHLKIYSILNHTRIRKDKIHIFIMSVLTLFDSFIFPLIDSNISKYELYQIQKY